MAIKDKITAILGWFLAPTTQTTTPVVQVPAPTTMSGFQLRGCRELLEKYGDSPSIRSQIEVIERAIPGDPGLAFTHCRGLLETVCRTILADRGVEPNEQYPKPSWLMSQALKVLKLTPSNFDGDDRVEDGVASVVRGLNQLINGVVALRDSQGVGPHGQDAMQAVLSGDYATICANAVDSAAALLYRLHKKQAEIDPLKRLRYGDHPTFDAALDKKFAWGIDEIPISASKALHHQELQEYRRLLVEFIEAGEALEADAGFDEGEEIAEDDDE